MKNKLLKGALALSLAGGMFVVNADDDFKGSIKDGFLQTFESKKEMIQQVKVPMIKAIEIAKTKASGQVVKAELEEEDDYFVYEIKIIEPNGDKAKVIVDPVTAKILKFKKDD